MKSGAASLSLSWVISALFATALSACGGGGDSGSSVNATDSSSQSQESSPLAASAVTPTVTSTNGSLIVSPGYLDLLVLTQSNSYQQQTLSVTVGYTGDGVLVGYAPGVQPVSWLSFSGTIKSAGQFDLPISLIPGSLSEGLYKTTLRFVSGYTNGTINGIVDLPVYLDVTAAPPVYTGDIVLGGSIGKLTGLARTIPLDFNGMVPDKVSAVPRSDMGAADQWLTVEGDWQTSLLTVRANPGLKVGAYAGFIDVNYTINGAPGVHSIPFKIVVQADTPVAERVAPHYLYAQGSSTLVLRGHAFSKAAAAVVKVGGIAANIATITSDTEIRATFNSPLPEGVYAVQVLLDGKATSLGDLTVISKPAYTQQDILPPCSTNSGDIIFDPLRGNIIGLCDGSYYVMGQRGGGWSVLTTRKIDGLDNASRVLTADQKYLVVAGKAQLILLDPATLQTIETRPIPVIWPDSAGYGSLGLVAALNNGKIILTISGVGQVYFAYDLDTQALTRTQQIQGHAVNASASAASLSTLQLVYVKDVNLHSMTSSDAELFTVTFFAAQDSWMADYAFPPVSPDGRKAAIYANGIYDALFNLYDTTSITQLGTVANSTRYNAPVLRFTESGNELFIVDGGQGRFDIYGAQLNDTSLKYSTTFKPYNYYAGLSNFCITPDQGAVILYGATNGNGVGSMPAIKIIPVSR
jgi:hypothetical protein